MWSYWQVRWYLWLPHMVEGLSLLPHVVIKQRPKSNLWKKGLFGSSVTSYSPHYIVLTYQHDPRSHHSVPMPNQSSLVFHHRTLLCNHNVPLVSPSRRVSGWALPWGYLTTRLHPQQELKAGTWRHELKQKLWRKPAYWLACSWFTSSWLAQSTSLDNPEPLTKGQRHPQSAGPFYINH